MLKSLPIRGPETGCGILENMCHLLVADLLKAVDYDEVLANKVMC